MKAPRTFRVAMMLLAAIALLVGTTACKHSGVAVTSKGQVMEIDIEGADDLPDQYTDTLKVSVQNKGPNNLHDVEFTVEFPREIAVVDESRGEGMEVMQMQTTSGMKLYHYRVGDIEPTESSVATFRIRTEFGTLDRTGDIKVTAWQADLPGDENRLVETKMIRLRR